MVGGADYCVRLDGSPAFFVGTSATSTEAAYKLPALWMVGQDVGFGSLDPRRARRVDCRARPSPRDEVAESLLLRCDAREYERRAAEIRSFLSRDAMLQGQASSHRRAEHKTSTKLSSKRSNAIVSALGKMPNG